MAWAVLCGRLKAEAAMQGDNAAGEIVIVATLETGLDHHVFQRVLVGMHANALGQVAIAFGVVSVPMAGSKLNE